MVFAIIMLVIALYMWFILPEEAEKKSTRGLPALVKLVGGAKTYIILVRILAGFCLVVSLREFYNYFFQ